MNVAQNSHSTHPTLQSPAPSHQMSSTKLKTTEITVHMDRHIPTFPAVSLNTYYTEKYFKQTNDFNKTAFMEQHLF